MILTDIEHYCKVILCTVVAAIITSVIFFAVVLHAQNEYAIHFEDRLEIIEAEVEIIKERIELEEIVAINIVEQTLIFQIQQIAKKNDNNDLSYSEAKRIFTVAKSASEKYGIDLSIFLALCATESNFNADAVSRAGAKNGRGLWQVSEIAIRDYNQKNKTSYRPSEVFSMVINSEIAAWTFKQNLMYKVDNTYADLLIAYNIGCKNWRSYAPAIKRYEHKSPNWIRIQKYLKEFDVYNLLYTKLEV